MTGGDRQDNYGHPLANHQRIAALWNGYLEARRVNPQGQRQMTSPPLEARDVVAMQILLKIARELHSSKRDNFVDIAGYARCGARIQSHEA